MGIFSAEAPSGNLVGSRNSWSCMQSLRSKRENHQVRTSARVVAFALSVMEGHWGFELWRVMIYHMT